MLELEKSEIDRVIANHEAITECCARHAEIKEQFLARAICAGEDLARQKSRLNHGEWEAFVRATYPFSCETAAKYMRCWQHRDKLKSVAHDGFDLSLGRALAMIADKKPKTKVPMKTAKVTQSASSQEEDQSSPVINIPAQPAPAHAGSEPSAREFIRRLKMRLSGRLDLQLRAATFLAECDDLLQEIAAE